MRTTSLTKEFFMPAKFTIFTDRAKKYRFNLKAANGEIIAASEAYDTKAAALKGIHSIQKSAPAAKIEDLEAEKDGGAKKTRAKRGAAKAEAEKKPAAARKAAVKKPAAPKENP
jgi:uncharacterized protein YegP (UPF0339 family)